MDGSASTFNHTILLRGVRACNLMNNPFLSKVMFELITNKLVTPVELKNLDVFLKLTSNVFLKAKEHIIEILFMFRRNEPHKPTATINKASRVFIFFNGNNQCRLSKIIVYFSERFSSFIV